MDLDLLSYVKLYKGVIHKDICDVSVRELNNAPWRLNEFYSYKDNSVYHHSGEKECYMYEGSISNINSLYNIVQQCTVKYVSELNFKWYNSFYGNTNLRFNRYIQNTLMVEHCDHINSIFDGEIKGIPTLTVLGLLNSDFTGGDLVLCNEYKPDFSGGDIIIFPSNFLYPHKIELVTSGIRNSFVSWVI